MYLFYLFIYLFIFIFEGIHDILKLIFMKVYLHGLLAFI